MAEVERTLEAIAEAGAVLDVNCAVFRRGLGPVYPLPPLLSQARKEGIPVTLGDDSHGPSTVGVGLVASLQAIADAGYDSVHRLTRANGWEAIPLGALLSAQQRLNSNAAAS